MFDNDKPFRIINIMVLIPLQYCNSQAIIACGYHYDVSKTFIQNFSLGKYIYKCKYFQNNMTTCDDLDPFNNLDISKICFLLSSPLTIIIKHFFHAISKHRYM